MDMTPVAVRQPALVYCPHPLLASANRELRYELFRDGESAAGYLRRLGYDLDRREMFLSLNGHLVRREDWDRVYPQPGDLITLRARVGDDSGGKNPLATVLSIALIFFAPGLGGALAGTTLGTTLGLSAAAAQGLIVAGGSLLINALLPPSKPNLSNALNSSSDTGAGTYSFSGGSNRARPYEPLVLVLGRQRVYPDLGGVPFTEFRGDDQYLIQVFHFGISDAQMSLNITDLRIGDTPITQFSDVVVDFSQADGSLPQVPNNVDVVAGGSLTAAAGYVTRTSSINTTGLAIEISALLFEINQALPGTQLPWLAGETNFASVVISGEYRPVGAEVWQPFFDGVNTFYATHYWSAGNYFLGDWFQYAFDLSYATLHQEGDQVVVERGPDEDAIVYFWRWRPYSEINGGVPGSALSAEAPPELHTEATLNIELTSKRRVPLRYATFLSVPAGQYEVRLRRLTPDSTSSNLVSEVQWVQMRSHQPDNAGTPSATNYTGQKRLSVSIKASGQLNGTLEQFNALAWSWVRMPGDDFLTGTQNPAWLMYAFMRGGTQGGRRTWGCNLPDARIDIDALTAFAAWCDSKALEFNGVIDQRMNCLDALNAIALAGRGSLTLANGKYGVVWDAPNQPVMQVFGLGNIKADSFSVRWVSEKLGDEIILSFWNRDKNQQDSVRALVPGVTAPANPVQVERFGVDNLNQARREANLIAAAQKYRRRFVTLEADYEGQVIARGDVVALSHDLFASTELTAWGYSGRLLAGTTTLLTLDRTVVMSASATNYAAVRFPDGQIYVREVVYAAGTPNTLTLASALPAAPNSDALNPVIDYVWLFGLDAQGAAKKFKVQDVQPLDDKDVRITLVDENPLYYAAENGVTTTPPVVPVAARLPSITSIAFGEELTRVGTGFAVQLSIVWDVSGVYDHANVRVTVDGALAWSSSESGRLLELTVPGDAVVDVTILPVHPIFGAGVPASARHTVIAKSEAPPDVPWISVNGDVITWGPVNYLAIAGYALRFHYGVNTDWGQASTLQAGLVTDSPLRMPVNAPGAVTLLIKAVSSFGVESAAAAYTVAVFEGPRISAVFEQRNWRFEDWLLDSPGLADLVNGTRVSNRPSADDANLQLWNPNAAAAMWGLGSDLMWHSATWKEMSYWRELEVLSAGSGSMLTLEHEIEGGAYRIEYRRVGDNRMWMGDGEPMWSGVDATPLWQASLPEGVIPRSMWRDDADAMWAAISNTPMWHARDGGFASWPGQIEAKNGKYEFLITTSFGAVRGRIVEVVSKVDAPLALESFNNVAISSGGTRLTLTQGYRQISAVSGAAFADGGAAIGFTVEDDDPALGPLIKTRDADGAPVAGTFTGFLQGYLS